LLLHDDGAGAGEEEREALGEVGHGVARDRGAVPPDGRGERPPQVPSRRDGPDDQRRRVGGRRHGCDSKEASSAHPASMYSSIRRNSDSSRLRNFSARGVWWSISATSLQASTSAGNRSSSPRSTPTITGPRPLCIAS